MTEPLDTAHYEFVRDTGTYFIYRIKGGGHCLHFPRWTKGTPPAEITIAIHDREQAEVAHAR